MPSYARTPKASKPPALRFPPCADNPEARPGTRSGAAAADSRRAGTFLKSATPPPYSQPQPPTPITLEALAHDTRNVLSSLTLYCDLLAAPGVLSSGHSHLALELEGMTKATVQLMERILDLSAPNPTLPMPSSSASLPSATPQRLPTIPVTDLSADLHHLQPLLAAIAGPSIRLSIATMPCAGRIRLAVEDLTRILVNLVRNAADAITSSGYIRITAQYGKGHSFLDPAGSASFGAPRCVLLSVSDNGPGIPAHLHDKIFDFGFTTHPDSNPSNYPRRRGLGLSTVRHLVESAAGNIRLLPAQSLGSYFEISLPLINYIGETITLGTYRNRPNSTFGDDSAMKGHLQCR